MPVSEGSEYRKRLYWCHPGEWGYHLESRISPRNLTHVTVVSANTDEDNEDDEDDEDDKGGEGKKYEEDWEVWW